MNRHKSYEIVFVSSHLGHVRGGAEINDLKLGAELKKLGHNVNYITQQDPNRDPRDIDIECRKIKTAYLYEYSHRLFEPAGKISRHLNEEWFRWKLQNNCPPELNKADFVLITGRPLLIKLNSVTDAPVFYSVRGSVNRFYYRHLLQADGLIFWGGCELEFSNDLILSRPQLTIDPAINNSIFYPKNIEQREIDKRREDGDLLAVYVGRLEPIKRIDVLVDAINEADEDIQLLIVGDGSQRQKLEERANQTAPDDITFCGYCEQESVAQFLNIADVFVLASDKENHPIALKEALACGTYCIAPDVGRIQSMITPETGTVIPDNDIKSVSVALDEAARKGITAKNRFDRACVQNTWRDNAEEIIKFYEQVL